ncbi:MAG: hypothetical protein ACXVC1_08545 [Tumebacillaceae bacterium]
MPLFHTANRSKQTGQPQQAKQASTQRPTTSVPHPLQLRQMPTDPQSILQLQQLYGNRAVGRMLSATPAPVQRMGVSDEPSVSLDVRDTPQSQTPLPQSDSTQAPIQKASVGVTVKSGVVSGITVSSRTSTGRSGGQGSHNTAYISFVDMVKLRVNGQTLANAAQNLLDCYTELLSLPGEIINNPAYVYARGEAFADCHAAVLNPDKDTIAAAIKSLLSMRNKMPLTRTDDGKKTVGNEWVHTHLMDMEKLARKGNNASTHKYYAQRYDCIWELFDYQPTTSVDNDEITSTVKQHILSMQATYEELFAQNDLTITDAAEYFCDTPEYWNRFTARMKKATTAYPDINQKKQDLYNEISSW